MLLVDDDVELCELITRFMAGEGFTVDSATDGRQGVQRALSGEYRLVLLDVVMPDINGFDVLRRIRAQSRLPVLMLTAKGDTLDRVLGLEMGADDYLPKPFDPPELAARVLLSDHASHQRRLGHRPARDRRPAVLGCQEPPETHREHPPEHSGRSPSCRCPVVRSLRTESLARHHESRHRARPQGRCRSL